MSVSLRRLRSHWIMIALAALAFVLLAPIEAQAAFQRTVSASTSVGSATLNPVLTATASNSSCTALGSAANLTVSWTMPAGFRATGYRITPTLVGSSTPQTVVTVSNPNATSAQVPVQRSLLGLAYVYSFQVQVLYNNWTSTAVTTNTASCPLLLGGV